MDKKEQIIELIERDHWDNIPVENTVDKIFTTLCVNNRREVLLTFYQHLIDNDPFPINSFSKEREVDRFLKANNCV
jgi:hypothetical protein